MQAGSESRNSPLASGNIPVLLRPLHAAASTSACPLAPNGSPLLAYWLSHVSFSLEGALGSIVSEACRCTQRDMHALHHNESLKA